jgi:cytochrome oxidase assembly protein ShyY1
VKRFLSVKEIAITLLSILLISLCLLAGQWQWNKGSTQTHQNDIIRLNLAKSEPLSTISSIASNNELNFQWRKVSLVGKFVAQKQVLVRNRYFQGQYGFEVLQLFQSDQGSIWINRGWVKAGENANTPPLIPAVNEKKSTVLARIRIEDLSKQLQGSFFAVPGKSDPTSQLLSQQSGADFNFHLDLLSSSEPANAPLTTIELPDLTNGPHYAYAIQWLAFATLILFGRFLLFRETQRLPLV